MQIAEHFEFLYLHVVGECIQKNTNGHRFDVETRNLKIKGPLPNRWKAHLFCRSLLRIVLKWIWFLCVQFRISRWLRY